MAGDEQVLGGGRYGTDPAGFAAMLTCARRWPERVWAVEGCEGIGKHLVVRLLDAGETAVDVPSKLSARMRVYATGQGRCASLPSSRRPSFDPEITRKGALRASRVMPSGHPCP
jgi:hypothetical protein